MSGIYVGIDGSSHSQLALEWAMREAVIRREPLTVIAVHEVPTSGWGGMIVYPQDSELREESRRAAQEVSGQGGRPAGWRGTLVRYRAGQHRAAGLRS